MKKEELVQLVLDGAGRQFGERTAAIHIGNIFNTIAGQLFAQDPNQWQFYTMRVLLTVTNRKATLTIPLIQTPNNAKGVIRVMPSGAESDCMPDDTEFYPMPQYALNSSVDANKMSWAVFYTVNNNTVRFNKSLPEGVTSLYADVVPEFSGYDDDDFISLPFGVAQLIIDGAVASLKGEEGYSNIYKKKT